MKWISLPVTTTLLSSLLLSACATDYAPGTLIPYPSPVPYETYNLANPEKTGMKGPPICKIGDPFPEGKLIRQSAPMPTYAQMSGWVVLGYDIVNGKTANVEMLESSNSMFEKPALKAMENWSLDASRRYADCRTVYKFKLIA